jgi:hypothetical protein
MKKLTLFASVCLLLVSCSTLYVKAPTSQTVTLMANQPASINIPLRQWSLLWGLIPLTNVNTETWVRQVNLGELRVKVYNPWYEYLWNIPAFFVLGLHSNTIVLEGNPPPPGQ